MKSLFKNIGLSLVCMLLIVGACFNLIACCSKDDPKETKVVNLAVNPSVEFVVDTENKVVSVSANNEDAVYLLEKFANFSGMTMEDAALKFLELSEQYGFVVEGSTDSEKFTISVSGNNAEDLYNDIKAKTSAKLTELGLDVSDMVEITKAELENIVAECYLEYSNTEINSMTEEELINLIKQSRIETVDLHSQDEKINYYRDRAKEIVESEIEAIKSYINTNASTVDKAFVTPYLTILDEIVEFVNDELEDLNSELQQVYEDAELELSNYINKKQEYLDKVAEYREALAKNSDSDPSNDVANIETLKQQYETLKSEAKNLYNSLDEEREVIKNELITFAKTIIQAQINLMNTQIEAIKQYVELNMEEIENEVNSKLTNWKNSYVLNSENPWEE